MMTWKEFAYAIHASGIASGNPAKIIVGLFKAAGCNSMPTEDAVRKWFSSRNKCQSSQYFAEEKINNNKGAIDFFRNRPKQKLEALKTEFSKINDSDNPIDVKTSDMDIFCRSIVNQFLDLLQFERLDIQSSKEIPDAVAKVPSAPVEKQPRIVEQSLQPEHLYDEFYFTAKNYRIKKFLICPVRSLPKVCIENHIIENCIKDTDLFAGHLASERKKIAVPNEAPELYKNISDFIDVLLEYLGFLKTNSVRPEAFPDNYSPVSGDNNEFKKELNCYQKKLSTSYKAIYQKVEKERESNVKTCLVQYLDKK